MKNIGVLLISVLFLRSYGAELLTNGDFETGNLNGWFYTLMSSSDDISAEQVDEYTDIYFLLDDGGTASWNVSLMQAIGVRKGYRYTITFGGAGIEDDKPVNFGINHHGGTGNGGDGSGDYTTYVSGDATFVENTYKEFKLVWDDTSVNDAKARIFFNGGGNDIDFFLSWVSVWESPIDSTGTPGAATARYNRFGFYTNGSKRIVVKDAVDSLFQIRSAAGTVLHTGTLSSATAWAPSGETVRIADISTVKTNGICTLYCNGKQAGTLTIAAAPLAALGRDALRAFYYQRASTPLSATCAGTWARAAGTPDNSVTIHTSAGSGTISAPKGWYDAGDYGKYIVNSGITMYTLLALYEHFPKYLAGLSLNVPESGNVVPDVLDEARWNLEWMLTMQTPDGGVYSKLTPLQFDETVMPEDATSARYVFMKSTPATLDFAAVMAMSSRLYKSYDAAFASTCLVAAKKAYAWATANPNIKYVQPSDCNTGEYEDVRFVDEFYWASVELALATGDNGTYSYHTANPLPAGGIPSWQDVGTLGMYTMLTNPGPFSPSLVDSSRTRIIANADTLLTRQKTGYGISMTGNDYYWGSNSVAVSQGILMLYAYYLTKKTEYLAGAQQQVDYLLGRNPFSRCFVTGYGDMSPLHPHHRPSEADGIAAPIPGFLVGGPHMGGQDTSYCGHYLDKPATSWLDKFCSSSTNEVAINWNATLAYGVNALEALAAGDTATGFVRPATQAKLCHDVLAGNRSISLISDRSGPVLHLSGISAGAQDGRCRIYNGLGRLIADVPLQVNAGGAYARARLPSECATAGCVVVRLEAGAATLLRIFILR